MVRPTKDPRSKLIRDKADSEVGSVWIILPLPVYKNNVLVGYEGKRTHLVELLSSLGSTKYDPFRDADGYYFDRKEAELLIHWIINECVIPEGISMGKPFIPLKWMWAVYFNMYCWKSLETGRRRYSEAFILVPRKNSKTASFGAIPALLSIFCDPEKGSQNFSAAADSEQASIVYRHADTMIQCNPRLKARLKGGKSKKSTREIETTNNNRFKVLSSEASTKHGLSPNVVIIDEVHAHPDSELIDVLNTGQGARQQPLTIYTTTADYDRPSACNELYYMAKSCLDGTKPNPNLLPVIYEAQREDDWESEEVWEKANPSYGITITKEYFRREVQRVKNNPARLNRFLRLHLNIQTSVENQWLDLREWMQTAPKSAELLTVDEIKERMEKHPNWFSIVNDNTWYNTPTSDTYIEQQKQWWTWFIYMLDELRDEECYAGYDHTLTTDIAALSLFFPSRGIVLPFFWVPGESIFRRAEDDKIPYDRWYMAGMINNANKKLKTIREQDILDCFTGTEEHEGIFTWFTNIKKISFDKWGTTWLYQQLQEFGFHAEAYVQGYAGMNPPCRKMEELVTQQSIFHGGNDILKWMVGNVMVKEDPNSRIMPQKQISSDRIDGVVATLMAMGRWMMDNEETILDLGLKDVESL